MAKSLAFCISQCRVCSYMPVGPSSQWRLWPWATSSTFWRTRSGGPLLCREAPDLHPPTPQSSIALDCNTLPSSERVVAKDACVAGKSCCGENSNGGLRGGRGVQNRMIEEVAHSQSLQQGRAVPGFMERKRCLDFGFSQVRLRSLWQRTAVPGHSAVRPKDVAAKPIRPVGPPPCLAVDLQKSWQTESVRREEHA